MKNLFEEIKSSQSIVIFAHEKPDGDAVGSALALFLFCKNLNKKVSVKISGDLPTNLLFLKDKDVINHNFSKKGDLAIVVDSPNLTRLGKNKFLPFGYSKIIMIDHHIKEENFANLSFLKVGYSSTCEVIYDLFCEFGEQLTPEIAYYLLVGILTDTGGLKYSNTTSQTFLKVSKLIDISKTNINELAVPLFSSITYEMFKLKQLSYEKIKFFNDNKIAFLAFSYQDLLNTGVTLNDTKVVIEIAMSLCSVKILALLTEGEPGVNYVSFRSKGFDVSRLAIEFGGGGHKEASGCKILDSFNNAYEKVLSVVLNKTKGEAL